VNRYMHSGGFVNRVRQKGATTVLPITLPTAHRFAKIFRQQS